MKNSYNYLFPLIFILSSLIINSCSNPELNNPFDPKVEFTTDPMQGGLTITQLTDSQVKLEWQLNESILGNYLIKRKINDGNFETIATVISDVNSYTDIGLLITNTYHYQLIGMTGNSQTSPLSNSISTSFAPITDFDILKENLETIKLIWQHNCDYEEGYVIEKRVGQTGVFEEIANLPENTLEFTDSGINMNVIFEYRLHSYSDLNTTADLVVQIENIFPNPENLSYQTTNYHNTTIDIELSWEYELAGFEGFRLFRNNTLLSETVSADSRTWTDTDVPIGDIYTYKIQAYFQQFNSGFSNDVICSLECVDYDGNVYETVQIGNQKWMVQNLKVTQYNNGDIIPNITDVSDWNSQTIGAFCYYSNDNSYADDYGCLYNWYIINDNRNVAPVGWHVPTYDEWQGLIDFLGGALVAGGKLKEEGTMHWSIPNTGATNESGFTAIPGGNRLGGGEDFYGLTYSSTFWTVSIDYYKSMNYTSNEVIDYSAYQTYGLSVRCIKD